MLKFEKVNYPFTYATAFYLLVALFCFKTNIQAQQITIDSNISAQQLIEDNLVLGCVEVSNITSNSNGSINQIASYGYFERSSSAFPFENGIMLSTGSANAAGNTTNANTLNDGETNWLTDPDLETALGISNTLNATSIEFDFVSVSNQVQFNYILASEEYYANYPCEYSDGFAFLIKEAGTQDPYVNIAVIPGTNIPVNTNTIHEEIVGFCNAENEQYFEGYNLGDTNFNGRTTVLTASANIQPNVQYHIKLVIADQTDENFDSAVFIEGNSFNASVNLGPDVTTCANSITLNGDTQNPLATYEWFNNGSIINGENNPTLTVNNSGTYTVNVSIPINNTTCEITDTINITLNSEQSAGSIPDYEICDDSSNDGIETFDLSVTDPDVLAAVPSGNYNISYHLNQTDAQNDTSSITSPIQNSTNPQTIYVRVEDIDNGCLAFSTFNLVVNPSPTITPPTRLEVCDDTVSDGITTIDLTVRDSEITNGNSNYTVNYHYTQGDADSGTNPVPTPYVNTTQTELLYVSVTDILTGCINTTTLTISVLDAPDINDETQTINACEQDNDGFEVFDLSAVIDDVLQGLTNISTSFHETYTDAETGNNPIGNFQNYTNTTPNVQTVYIRVVDNVTGCASIASIVLHTNILDTATNIRNFSRCDDESNDGIVEFNLENIANTIINGLNDVTVYFYETEDDRDNNTNVIDQTIPYEVTNSPHQLFISIQNPDCIYDSEISLIINEATIIQPLSPITYCDTDDDTFTSIELSVFDSSVSTGIPNANVSYYLNENDALDDVNPLPPFHTNTTNPLTLYVRVTNTATNCYDVEALEIEVLPAPTTTRATDIIVCDDDQDAFTMVNLENKISEMVTNTSGLNISFHTSITDAENSLNAIINTTTYSANTQTIYTRIENDSTGCFSIESFEIIVNTLPEFSTITNFRNCETDGNQVADFLFSDKDNEILNGQGGKRVLYFETQTDAANRTNSIDKNSNYQNTSNPQTIFCRVENISDIDCYGIDSFVIEVGSIPVFNAPLDMFLCDDISNDGQEEFDLSRIEQDMAQGSPDNLNITFYISLDDAENGENEIPLNFTNQTNPQQIYARVENGTYCHGIAEFGLNVIQVPLVNQASAMEQCDTDYDGSVGFDLTVSEIEVLDVRQNDIVVSYHESLDDLEANSNPIQNPNNYNNTSNPQTVYIRVTNTVSNCYVALPLELIVNLPPTINAIGNFEACDNDSDSFELDNTIEALIGNQTNVDINFYSSQSDADNAQNPLNSTYNYTSNSDTIFVRAENTLTGCFTTASFNLIVNPLPSAGNAPNMEACDDDYDALLIFNLSQQTPFVLGGLNTNNYTVSYFELLEEATDSVNPIIDLNYEAFHEQTIYARLENNATGCFTTTSFITLIQRKPEVVIPDQTVCLDNLPLVVSAETGFDTDSYLWSNNQTTPEIEITQIGTYSVTVTSAYGCTTTATFNVIESEQATIEFTETIDFSDPNNITVTISGIGNYVYILDGGPPQESNTFYNVTLGPHTIEVYDLNGCASAIKDIVIIDAPLFFTPNNDGQNDTWHITGVDQLVGTIVYIYDRYGKLIKTLRHTSQGWDGSYNGRPMPTNDYWFVANVKKGDKQFEVRRHFTLKR
ncbi:choice-of-anchor L domain-containing protein [Hanstruepera marina]|uniref:choice-of-anchor L domain-containing protein n=1 Tax=Hanstruepera marina TaxID=2873265 RepID=UPI00210471DD|nr:choice-of-anchor L domain-containing protein [Hanstruepera marina]